jgi:biopolymer transport protein ExbB/TolQ
MAFEIIFILVLIALQIYVFTIVLNKIKRFKNFFPDSFKIQITKEQLSDDQEDVVELLKAQDAGENFGEIVHSTNDYLRKNKGAAADFGILKDISERHLEKFDNEIGNQINVPLYIGLGGTFLGIIIGLFGISFTDTTGAVTISSTSISQLLSGVITAMFASLFGLIFTVINSWLYKSAAYQNETDKNNYYDLLQRELLPALNTGVAKSLGTLNVVLNEFIRKFGENMDDYRDSGRLLNENLTKQQFVLEEINKLSLTRTATTIANTFVQLNESSDHLAKFIDYQKGLNEYVDKAENVTQEMDDIIDKFKDFNLNLKAVSNNTLATIELQKQFKDSLETHFPARSDFREKWREQTDELNQDVKKVYAELYNYFKEQTEQLKNFTESNSEFFSGIGEIQKAVQVFAENSNAQKAEFEVLKNEMINLRKDLNASQKSSLETNNALIDALKEIKKDTQKETIESHDLLVKAIKGLDVSISRFGKIEKSKEK